MVVSVAKPDRRLPADLEYLVANALGAVLALAARVANSSRNSRPSLVLSNLNLSRVVKS